MTPSNPNFPPAAAEAEEEIIELTEVLDHEASETVIEFSSSLEELDSLDLKSLLGQETAAEPEPPAPEPPMNAAAPMTQESLDDLLMSLQGMPSDEPIPEPRMPLAESLKSEELEALKFEEPESLDFEMPAPPPPPKETLAAPFMAGAAALPAGLDEDQLREMVREIVRETVERLCREMFPALAAEVVTREIDALKESLEEEG